MLQTAVVASSERDVAQSSPEAIHSDLAENAINNIAIQAFDPAKAESVELTPETARGSVLTAKPSADTQRCQEDEIQQRYNAQVDGVIDALMEMDDLIVPYSCIVRAACETVDLDGSFLTHATPVKNLIPEAITKAKDLAKMTTLWYWKADSDKIKNELNRVLNPLGITVDYPEFDNPFLDVEFEFRLIDTDGKRLPLKSGKQVSKAKRPKNRPLTSASRQKSSRLNGCSRNPGKAPASK